MGVVKFGSSGGTNLDDPSFISVTQTNNITSVGSDDGTGNIRTLFDANDPGTTPVLATNARSTDITFDSSGGTFTVDNAGNYYIEVTMNASVSAGSSNRYDVKINVDGTQKHIKENFLLSGQDAIESTSAIVLALDADDRVTVQYVDDGTRNIFIHKGTTVNITRIGNVGSGGGGGGGSGITINNNVAGYILKATGDASVIEGMPQFVSSSTGISSSVDFYISGSNSPSSAPNLFIQGTDANGNISKMKIVVENGFLKMVDDDIE